MAASRYTALLLLLAGPACDDDGARPPDRPVAVLVGAGDIAGCESQGHEATAALLDTIAGIVFTTGDNVQGIGAAEEFTECYDSSWGRHRERTRPTIGNHDYATEEGAPYYAYFGARAGEPGKGYYAYDAGVWRVIVLNSNLEGEAATEQGRWLETELAERSAHCTLAYWHHPRFSSGSKAEPARTAGFWEALYDAGAEVVLVGHEHVYERFAPQTPRGRADPDAGIRQFTVGTGGTSLFPFRRVARNSEVRINETYGVLRLVLHPGAYDWTFIGIDGRVLDDGSARCH